MTPEQMESEMKRLRAEVTDLKNRLDRADQNGLNNLWFRNLFPESGSGNNGTENQAARSDHSHA